MVGFFQAGGFSRGAINVALLLQIFQYTSKPASQISNIIVFAGSIGKYSFTSQQRDTTNATVISAENNK